MPTNILRLAPGSDARLSHPVADTGRGAMDLGLGLGQRKRLCRFTIGIVNANQLHALREVVLHRPKSGHLFMRTYVKLIVLLLAAAVAGCSGSKDQVTPPAPPGRPPDMGEAAPLKLSEFTLPQATVGA